MAQLILISCSSTKKNILCAIPAIDRYDGVFYRIIKKARREGYWPDTTDLFMVSAKYGLISEYELIEPYDQKMTQGRAAELQEEVGKRLDTLLRGEYYAKIFLTMGVNYMQSLTYSQEIERARQTGRLQEAVGGIGMRQKQMKAWILGLCGEP